MTYTPNNPGETERRIALADKMMTDPAFAGWVEHVEAMAKAHNMRGFGEESAKELLVALLEDMQRKAVKR